MLPVENFLVQGTSYQKSDLILNIQNMETDIKGSKFLAQVHVISECLSWDIMGYQNQSPYQNTLCSDKQFFHSWWEAYLEGGLNEMLI